MQKTIGVFFGGKSPEHDVSIITGEFIISGLKKLNYEVAPIYLDKTGEWHLGEELGELKFFNSEEKEAKLSGSKKIVLDLEDSQHGKLVFTTKGLIKKKNIIDLAFPAFHGLYGEDGTIQGLFEILGVPYVGCDVASSAIAMDKALTKLFYQANNIPTTKFFSFLKSDWEKNQENILAQIKNNLAWPIFIKPVHLGSSIGIAKVEKKEELKNAIEVALHYDNKFLAEDAVNDLADLTCACLGNNNLRTSLIQESIFNKNFFSYEDKYLEDGGAQLGNAQNNIIIPAKLSPEITSQIEDLTKNIFKLLGCSGIARVDFLLDKSAQKVYANEINTLPGTLYHHLWEKSGLNFSALLEELIKLAEEKYETKQSVSHSFESSILAKANSAKLRVNQ